jgi:nitroreductase
MDDILEFLNSHASVRNFTDQPITTEQEHLIITTAQRSPTSSNLQAYSIISVHDQAKKDRLATLSGGQDHVAKSALFLVFLADLHRLARECEKRGYDFQGDHTELLVVATIDATLAAGRALMAAQAMELGGVMVGGLRNDLEAVTKLLKLPRLVFPVMGMSLGHPVRDSKVKPRLPREALHFVDHYDQAANDEGIAAYDQTISELGYLKGREVEPERYPEFDGVYSWSEHSARRVASQQPGALRAYLKEYLKAQGLMLK